jgi:hypothetical protein
MWLFGCSFPSVLVMWFFLLPCPCRSAEEIKGCRADSGAVRIYPEVRIAKRLWP